MQQFFNEPKANWFFTALNSVPWLAHHPTCPCYDNHLIRFRSRAVCLGCFCLWTGVVIALVAVSVFSRSLGLMLDSWWINWLVGLALFAPTLIQPFCQYKWFKAISRTLLGVSISLLWYGTLFAIPWNLPGVCVKVVFALVFWAMYRITQNHRARHTPNPRNDCERGCYPFCEGNRRRLELLLKETRERYAEEDSEFVRFAEGVIDGNQPDIEVLLASDLSHDGKIGVLPPARTTTHFQDLNQ